MLDLFVNEEKVFAGPFFLVSYSHQDKEIVREDVDTLVNKGVRLWIDHRNEHEGNMTYGHNWKTKIQNALSHPNCKGALIYISGYSLAGKATRWEHDEIRGRNKKYILISLNSENRENGTPINRHFRLAEDLCDPEVSDNSFFIDQTYADKDELEQKKWINNDIIHIRRTSSDMCVSELMRIAETDGALDTSAHTTKMINEKSSRDMISLGIYKSREVYDAVPDVCDKDSRFRRGGEDYLFLNKKVYSTKPIKWRFLYVTQNATCVFISCEVLDQCAGTEIDAFLEKFKSIAFSDKDASLVKNFRILSPEDINAMDEKTRSSALELPLEQKEQSWWFKAPGLLSTWQQLYKGNKPYGHGCLVTLHKGIRPVIEVTTVDLKNNILG